MLIKEVYAADIITEQDGAAPLYELATVFGNVISALLGLAGIILFIMVIIGGFNLLTSGGDPGKAGAARATLTYAVGGIILVSFAYLIIRLIHEITGADILQFVVYR